MHRLKRHIANGAGVRQIKVDTSGRTACSLLFLQLQGGGSEADFWFAERRRQAQRECGEACQRHGHWALEGEPRRPSILCVFAFGRGDPSFL